MLKNLYRPITTCLIISAISAISALALPASYFASSSRLSSGRWVKIRVTENGMQELTFDALRAMGFNDPEKVAVFGYPSWTMGSYLFDTAMPDDLPAVPSAIYGDKLVFYGEGCIHPQQKLYVFSSANFHGLTLLRNLDGKDSFYFLTDSYAPATVEISDADKDDLEILTDGFGICATDYRKRSPGHAGSHLGAYLVGENCTDAERTENLYLPFYNPDSYPILLTTGVTTFTPSASNTYKIQLANSITTKSPVKGYGSQIGHVKYYYGENTDRFPSVRKTDDDIYPLSLRFSNNYANAEELAFDYFTLTYPRYTELGKEAQDVIIIPYTEKSQAVRLKGATTDTKVWNTSDPLAPFEMKLTDIDGYPGVVTDRAYSWESNGGGMQIVAFDPGRTLAVPEVIGAVDNQDLHSIDVPEMLIVSSSMNLDQANRLAELHRLYTGTDVKVVEFGQVCNEFGSGARHPMAVRRMAKMLFDRDPSRFKALLLMGKSARDNNGVVATETEEQFNSLYIPMLHCEDITMDSYGSYCGQEPTAYATDAIYGMLNDNFTYNRGTSQAFLLGSADIQVARIPAGNPGDALAYLNKVERYLTTPSTAPLWNSALVFSDAYDSNMHIEQGEHVRRIIAEYSPATTVTAYTRALNPDNRTQAKNRLLATLSRGVSFWQYMGHSGGAVSILAWDNNMNKDVLIQDPPFTMFATCQTQILDSPATSLQVDMLFNENGGMMGGIGSTRSVYANYNHVASQMGSLGYFTRKPGATFGEVWMAGRQQYSSAPGSFESGLGKASQINTMSFNFIGDPMLPMRVPEGSVKVTTINGDAVPESMVFTSFEPQVIEGAIYTPDGEVDSSFNGTVIMQVYDGNFTAVIPEYTLYNVTTPARTLNFDDYLLQQVKFDIKNGRFAGTLTCALPQHDGDYNRVTFFAQTDDLLRTSVGTLDNVKIIGNSEFDATEAILPEITSMYAIDTDFHEGDCLPAAFTLHADVTVGSLGLIGASDHVGGAMSLTLDDSKRFNNVDSYFTLDSNGNGHLAMPVKDLSDGQHYLTFSVADLSGETVSRSISFVVANVTEGVVKIENEFCTDQAVLDVDHGHDLETIGRVVITNPAGKVIYTAENASFPFTWNLDDNEGNAIDSGIYSAKVYFKADRRYGFAAPVRIVVGKK